MKSATGAQADAVDDAADSAARDQADGDREQRPIGLAHPDGQQDRHPIEKAASSQRTMSCSARRKPKLTPLVPDHGQGEGPAERPGPDQRQVQAVEDEGLPGPGRPR
jgi:hypothetical protein